MSRTFLLDVETLAKSEAELLAMMDEELRNPSMPENIANPFPADLSKCPKYEREKDPESKRSEWIEKTKSAWLKDTQLAKAEWSLKASAARQSWMDDAALHAPRSSTKLIAIRDTTEGITSLMVIDATPEERKRIEAEEAWPCKVKFVFVPEEVALNAFAGFVNEKIGRNPNLKGPLPTTTEHGVLSGYFIQGYDLPYLMRRAFILGAKTPSRLRKGRYWDNDLIADLDEIYKMGEKDLKIGGLRGLSRILGVEEKQGDGEQFGEVWKRNPCDGVRYNLSEGLVIEACARKMGIVS